MKCLVPQSAHTSAQQHLLSPLLPKIRMSHTNKTQKNTHRLNEFGQVFSSSIFQCALFAYVAPKQHTINFLSIL